jgi:predicted HicB family RNase H-like nuclease
MPRKQIFKPGSNEEETILGIRVTKEMRHHLKLIAVKRKISMAELIRKVIEDFLTKNKKEIKA